MAFKALITATGIALSHAATSGIAPMDTCYHQADIEAWTAPLNEPCYIHDGDICDGYMVCCVKAGTCKSSGGTVSSTEEYYEGACVSDQSSKGATAAGCMGKVGECMEKVLTGVMGATGHGSGTTAYVTPSQTVIDRMAAAFDTSMVTETSRYTGEVETVEKVSAMKQPCMVWETYDVTITLDGAEMGDMNSGLSLMGKVCAKIGEAAGVAGYHVECTAEATAEGVTPAGVVVTGQVHADELKVGEAHATFLQNMGTAAQTEKMLMFPPTASRWGSTPGYNATVTKTPTISQDNWYPSPPPPPIAPDDDGLSTGAIVGIAVGAGVGGLLLLGGVAFFVMKSMAAKPALGKATA